MKIRENTKVVRYTFEYQHDSELFRMRSVGIEGARRVDSARIGAALEGKAPTDVEGLFIEVYPMAKQAGGDFAAAESGYIEFYDLLVRLDELGNNWSGVYCEVSSIPPHLIASVTEQLKTAYKITLVQGVS